MTRDVKKVLAYLTRRGAVTHYEEAPNNRYTCWTADGKPHVWTSGQVLSFWAGVFAGINLERKSNGCSHREEAARVPGLPGA